MDTFEFCSDRLKATLGVHRDRDSDEMLAKAKGEGNAAAAAAGGGEEEEKEGGGAAKAAAAAGDGDDAASAVSASAMEVELPEGASEEEREALEASGWRCPCSRGGVAHEAATFPPPPPSRRRRRRVVSAVAAGAAGPGLPGDFRGNYELFGVVTHKGREADGGHYMGWVKQEGGRGDPSDKWFVFDDADVSETTEEEVMKLKGGGDWHMAYLTFYRYKN
ncbi:unnamed protein product [Heterosigma akashiwo]